MQRPSDPSILWREKFTNTKGFTEGNAYILGRSSETSNLYSEEDASMDSLSTFSPMDTSGFIAIQAIRLKKYGEGKIAQGKPLTE